MIPSLLQRLRPSAAADGILLRNTGASRIPTEHWRGYWKPSMAMKSLEKLKHRTLLMLVYASGPRVSEVVKLRVADIDGDKMLLNIKGAKGRKIPVDKNGAGNL